MPNPVPLATKEEEERRTWVTSHHEVVRLIKDCFGDRFSNNEIFDRLKISRRTGYRALGNDERIGKAPGRKPKISEDKLREIIVYMEEGGCNDVGNVWKHLASKFAPDCNPKTVQDAVKKLGFRNHHNTVKLEPLLNPDAPDDADSADEDGPLQPQPQEVQQASHPIQSAPQQQIQQPPSQRPAHELHQDAVSQQQQQQQQQQPNVIDPSFHQNHLHILHQAIMGSPDSPVRYILWDLCSKIPDAERYTASILLPYIAPSNAAAMNALASSHHLPRLHPGLPSNSIHGGADQMPGKRSRVAICRRCNQQFNRAENTMDNRQCVYHIGAISKTVDDENGTVDEAPDIYMWSCCGGNGLVRGCKLAMHTTKRKRKYGKKRTATDAHLDKTEGSGGDGEDDEDDEDDPILTPPPPQARLPSHNTHNATHEQIQNSLESGLDSLPHHGLPSHMGILGYTNDLSSPFLQHSSPPGGIHVPPPQVQPNGHGPIHPDVQAQLQMAQSQNHPQM